MKISVFGAGNVGSTTAMRLAQEGLGDIVVIDIAGGIAKGKALDLQDAAGLVDMPYTITGSDDLALIQGSDIVVVTAGLARKPGMTREELLLKNAAIVKDIFCHIKRLAGNAIVIMVTNPLDVMTNYALRMTGWDRRRLFGMGVSLDAARFANLISQDLSIPVTNINAAVIGSHGEGMMPLSRFTTVNDVNLCELMDAEKIADLTRRTVGRGAQIVAHLGTGSAYYAPSAAVAAIVRSIVKDQKRVIGVCAHVSGEYGLKDICIGVPCRIGREGIEEIIELDLDADESASLHASADSIRHMTAAL